jgi:predicted alpha/beta-hydrolase family hydrolase
LATSDRLLLLAPGAGAPSASAWMQAQQRRLATLGRVETFDYPYQVAGRKLPDRLPVLIEAHARALEAASAGHAGPKVLVGKSMGGRVGCHLAVAQRDAIAALVCLGYPLVGVRGDVRDAVLLELERPVLFVQGTRDTLCPLERLALVRARMKAPNELFVVEGGNHSLIAGKRELSARGETQATVNDAITLAIERFLDQHAPAHRS